MSTNTGIVDIRGKDYKTVALRVTEFREAFPLKEGWAILTELRECTADSVLVMASVVNPEGRILSTGHAHETWESQINRTSAVENCETSAIGRALASAGFAGSEFCSANELQRAQHQQRLDKSNRPNRPPARTRIDEHTNLNKWERHDVTAFLEGCRTTADLRLLLDRMCAVTEWVSVTNDWEWLCKQIADTYRSLAKQGKVYKDSELEERLKEEYQKLKDLQDNPFGETQEADNEQVPASEAS